MTAPDFDQMRWQKSSRSNAGGSCVEIGQAPCLIGVRDTKLGKESPVLTFDQSKWVSFLDAIKRGEADS